MLRHLRLGRHLAFVARCEHVFTAVSLRSSLVRRSGGGFCLSRWALMIPSVTNFVAVDAVSISEEIPGRILISEGFDDLLGRPGCRGMLRDIEMQHLATAMFQYDEHKQHFHRTFVPPSVP